MNDANLLLLAEKMSVPCASCQKNPGHTRQLYLPDEPLAQVPICPDCNGSGRRFPLQKPCPGEIDFSQTHWVCVDGTTGDTHSSSTGPHTCQTCQGRGWLPIGDRDQIEAALRERGWGVRTSVTPDGSGDEVIIRGQPYNGWPIIGKVKRDEELRGTDALVLAALRAVEASE